MTARSTCPYHLCQTARRQQRTHHVALVFSGPAHASCCERDAVLILASSITFLLSIETTICKPLA
jgi:hypothetical protein